MLSFLKSLRWHPGTRETSTDMPSVSAVFKVADIWPLGSPSLANLLISLRLLFFEYPFDIPLVGGKETRSLEESKLGLTSSLTFLGSVIPLRS